MASRGCKHPARHFAMFAANLSKRAKKYSMAVSTKMCEVYKAYFGMPFGDQEKFWAPQLDGRILL